MSSKNKVVVKIMGHEYKLVSDDTREYMQKISNYVDDRMNEISEGNKKLSTAMIAVLSALNIADDYFKLQESMAELEKKTSNPVFELQKTKEKIEEVNQEINKKNMEYESMVEQFEGFLQSSSVYEEELSTLKEKLNMLSFELLSKEDKLKKSTETIVSLEKQLKEAHKKKDQITFQDSSDDQTS